jgi:ligand-binding SRPBCC domain-containing protein
MAPVPTRLTCSVVIHAPIDRVFHFHDDTKNLIKITPPSIKISFESFGPPGLGYEVKLKVVQFGFIPMYWHVRITDYVQNVRMVDEQLSGPFTMWKQRRDFTKVNGGTMLTDTVEYAVPFGPLGRIVDRLFVRKQIHSMFAYRQARTKALLEDSTELISPIS